MIAELTEKQREIRRILLEEYLPTIELENSILRGNLLSDEVKKFLENNPNAFLLGLIADQSVKAELAWSLPYNLKNRLNTFDFEKILEEQTVESIEMHIKEKPALHRYPNRMALYIYSAIRDVVKMYKGNAENIWKNRTAMQIVESLEQFKGISHKKASLGAFLLVRDLLLDIQDKENIDIAYDVHIRRIFLRTGLVDKDTEEDVLEMARKLNKEFPGQLTTPFWTIGREYCLASEPACLLCPLSNVCEKRLEKVR